MFWQYTFGDWWNQAASRLFGRRQSIFIDRLIRFCCIYSFSIVSSTLFHTFIKLEVMLLLIYLKTGQKYSEGSWQTETKTLSAVSAGPAIPVWYFRVASAFCWSDSVEYIVLIYSLFLKEGKILLFTALKDEELK